MTARTLNSSERDELIDELMGAIESLGIDAKQHGTTLVIDGANIELWIEERSHNNPAALTALVTKESATLPALMIADRISDAGREVLRQAGWSWLDRRGHLRMWASGLRIESAFEGERIESRRNGNLWTTVGLEIAVYALCHPDEPISARRVALAIGRSPGAAHDLISRFVNNGLIGQRTKLPLLPELFWETVAQWPDEGWTPLPLSIGELASELHTSDLIRVDERAATLGGAQIPAAGDLSGRCYVSTARQLRRARTLVNEELPTQCWVRQSPIAWLPTLDDYDPDPDHPWMIAHPIVAALRLARDPSRGREIVEAWGIVPNTEIDNT